MKTYRHLHLVGATSGELRTAEFNGVDHLVVPVVALVEGVVWAMNSELPEFVPAEEMAVTPQQWNGRQCFAGHPVEAGNAVTANTPRKLAEAFGVIFAAAPAERILETRRLELEAWLDPVRAAKVSPAAEDVITRLRAGETVEVSVGCFIEREDADGHHDGKDYHGIWRNIVSDHLAFLAAGETGACSVEAGCGAPRAAIRHLVTEKGISRAGESMPTIPTPQPGTSAPAQTPPTPVPAPTPAPPTAPSTPPRAAKGLLQRMMDAFRTEKAQPGQSDRELRSRLDSAIRAVEPGYMSIDEVFPGDNIVIYSAYPADKWLTLRRSYSQNGEEVSLADDREEVEPVVSYEPVTAATAAAASSQPLAAGTCGCHAKTPEVPVAAQSTTPQGEDTMNEATKKLIARSAGKFTDADAVWLDTVPVERHDALLGVTPAPVVPTPEPVVAPVVAAAKTPQQMEDEYLAGAPQTIRDLVSSHRAAETARKTQLVASLKTCQSEFTEEELNGMPAAQLERLSRALLSAPSNENDDVRVLRDSDEPLVDFSGRGQVPLDRAAAEKDVFTNAPDPWAKQLEARRGK